MRRLPAPIRSFASSCTAPGALPAHGRRTAPEFRIRGEPVRRCITRNLGSRYRRRRRERPVDPGRVRTLAPRCELSPPCAPRPQIWTRALEKQVHSRQMGSDDRNQNLHYRPTLKYFTRAQISRWQVIYHFETVF